MLDTETKRRIDTARDILVGKVPDPKSQVEQITIALIYKFMDDMDAEAEELGGERTFFQGEYAQYGWSRLLAPDLSSYEMLTRYSEALIKMNQNPNIPQLFRDIFKNTFLPYRDPATLKSFLKIINDFQYDHSERLGDAFEYLLSVMDSQGDAGQFRTPRHIIDFMVAVLDPQKHQRILDPACGTAGFLISAYKHILNANSLPPLYSSRERGESFPPSVPPRAGGYDEPPPACGGIEGGKAGGIQGGRPGAALTPDERQRLATNINGYDISPDMVRLSRVNLYLHGFSNPLIHEYDTLTSEDKWDERADVILANPPFMSPKGGIRPHKRFSVQSNRSEVLFVDYIAEHLNPGGRAAVIVPEGIIFQSQRAYKQLRKMLVEHYLFGVVSLPAGVFQPYSGVKTSILLMDKSLSKRLDSIIFVKIESDGFDLGAQRRKIDRNDLPAAVTILRQWVEEMYRAEAQGRREEQDISRAETQGRREEIEKTLRLCGSARDIPLAFTVVEKARIAENGEYNLSGERYKNEELRITNYELVELGEVCEVNPDSINPKEEFGEKQFHYIDISSVENSTGKISEVAILKGCDAPSRARRGVKVGDVLLSTVRPNLKAFCFLDSLPANSVASTGFAILRAKTEHALGRFIYHMVRSDEAVGQMINMMGRGAYPSINQKDVASIKIPLPPMGIQETIVAEIEGYQRIIDGARQVVAAYKPQIKIDPEWGMVALGEMATIMTGGTPAKSLKTYWEGDIPWVSPKDMKCDFIEDTEDHISLDGVKNSSTKLVKANTILCVVRSGILKHSLPVAIATREMCFNQDIISITTVQDQLNYKFIFYYLKTQGQAILSQGIKTGVTVQSFTAGYFHQLKIPLPDLATQQRIVAQIEEEQALVAANKKLITLFEQKNQDTIAAVWSE
jgi:type I restriction enzyme M protein